MIPTSGTAVISEDTLATSHVGTPGSQVPHIVAWNLTKRCNLACAHCYISAGSWHAQDSELPTKECMRILNEILDLNPNPMLILTGGEPLLRDDLEAIADEASSKGATVVIGTNGTGLTETRIDSLMKSGVKGVAVSVDSLRADYHDRFRHGGGALRETQEAVGRCAEKNLDFVIQTTVTSGNRHELKDLAKWAADAGAISFNVYFVVPTGRAERMKGMNSAENEEVLKELVSLEKIYRGTMMVRSKCQPQIMRHVFEESTDSSLLNYETRCPCGVHYVRITPEGKVTPCPYMPVVAGDLLSQSFKEIWETSPVFADLREGNLSGRCGRCEYREVCGGCRARAYAETGDYLGPDDSCAYDPTGEIPLVKGRQGVSYGQHAEDISLEWTPEAYEKVQKIPSFVRGVVVERLEKYAKAKGYEAIDLRVMKKVREDMPVDFSKKRPFFLGRGGRA
ncbi:MAG: radical SAM domain protein, coenzyme PQQ synthesis protein E [Gemmatimonadetes bacterium]|nr:radical SAM domain protein, coenzyme PQQ synthesis protein E [Gemmatimonadota bacterium]